MISGPKMLAEVMVEKTRTGEPKGVDQGKDKHGHARSDSEGTLGYVRKSGKDGGKESIKLMMMAISTQTRIIAVISQQLLSKALCP